MKIPAGVGIIAMVSVTVILAAVLAWFVFEALGGGQPSVNDRAPKENTTITNMAKACLYKDECYKNYGQPNTTTVEARYNRVHDGSTYWYYVISYTDIYGEEKFYRVIIKDGAVIEAQAAIK